MNREQPERKQSPTREEKPRPRWWNYLLQAVAAVALAVLILVIASWVWHRQFAPSPLEAEFFPKEPGPAETPALRRPEPRTRRAGGQPSDLPPTDLRRMMAGLLMAQAGLDEGEYEHPENQTPEARRRFLADRFGLPPDAPAGGVPEGMVPEEAQVLAAFAPTPDKTVVMTRFRLSLSKTLSLFNRLYDRPGWTAGRPRPSSGAEDRGWLIEFTGPDEVRYVFARARHGGDESLAVVYGIEK